jgi:hypothetical protein
MELLHGYIIQNYCHTAHSCIFKIKFSEESEKRKVLFSFKPKEPWYIGSKICTFIH